MKRIDKWFSIAVPAGWADVVVRTVKVAVVAFVTLHLKEFVDAGFPLDTPDITIDALWVTAGTFALNAILMWAKSWMVATSAA